MEEKIKDFRNSIEDLIKHYSEKLSNHSETNDLFIRFIDGKLDGLELALQLFNVYFKEEM